MYNVKLCLDNDLDHRNIGAKLKKYNTMRKGKSRSVQVSPEQSNNKVLKKQADFRSVCGQRW